MKKFLVLLFAVLLISISTINISAASYLAPQDMDGLQNADIKIYLGDLPDPLEPALRSDQVTPTTAYTSGIDIAAIITDTGTLSNTRAQLVFTWPQTAGLNFNAIFIKNIPSDFRITISATGISSFTGSDYSQSLDYVDQKDGWYRFDSFSFSATQTPVFSQIFSLTITIDGGSALLSTLADDSIILSLSMLPYNINAASDLQYQIGYQDAQKVYKDILQQEKQNSYDSGVLEGYSDGLKYAEDVLIPEAEDLARADGYAEGKADGMSIAENGDLRDLIFAIPEAHLTALEGFTNWDLLGYNLYDLFGGLATLVIVAALFMIGFKFLL